MRWERLAKAIKDRGFTQTDLKEQSDLSHSQISEFIAGKRKPDFNSLCNLAIGLNISTDYLFGRTEDISEFSDYGRPDFLFHLQKLTKNHPELQEVTLEPRLYHHTLYKIFNCFKDDPPSFFLYNGVMIKRGIPARKPKLSIKK